MMKNRQIELEKSPLEMCALMLWCRENGIPALVCFVTVTTPDLGYTWKDVNNFVGTRKYLEAGHLLTDPLEDNQSHPFFVRVRDRDRSLFLVRAR
jgi:hypothetical protein